MIFSKKVIKGVDSFENMLYDRKCIKEAEHVQRLRIRWQY